jgi:sarcosine oxidase subunit gamma
VPPQAIGDAFGLAIEARPRVFAGAGISLIGTGPDSWLAFADPAPADFAQTLAERLAGLASVSDQSSGYCVFSLSGATARTVLQRGAAIDFHDDAFGPGSVATTMIAHIGVIIWRPGEAPAYDIALFGSFMSSFRHWLARSSAAL